MLNTIAFVGLLGVLIIAHEFGHFIVAKLSGVGVERFAIGFGPVIFKHKGKETEFVVCALPLGGYVKLAGDNRGACKGLANEFFSKPIATRIRIVLAGPVFNYLLAFILFWAIAVIGFSYLEPVVGNVKTGYPAQAAGLLPGDRITKVNDKTVESWTEMTYLIRTSSENVRLLIEREGVAMPVVVSLKEAVINNGLGEKKKTPIIGIEASGSVRKVQYNVFTGFIKGAEYLYYHTMITVFSFAYMILGKISATEAVGPLGIYAITSEAVRAGIVAFLSLAAALNISLAVINLCPLPVLDGGHIFLFGLEKLRGKPLSEKAEDILAKVGIAAIGFLCLFVFYNDILRFGPRLWGKDRNAGITANQAAPDEPIK
ncbi:MAG: RIP metalloprotease RseP [Candidatus Omnitrophota bacterium]|nr:RIP metalloprotease RseP [Candidatus Omnitrophota bacterium]